MEIYAIENGELVEIIVSMEGYEVQLSRERTGRVRNLVEDALDVDLIHVPAPVRIDDEDLRAQIGEEVAAQLMEES